jgi:hypothetical protein
MPNGVKYSTTTPSGSLRRDNVALGVNGNLGPTANTGFYSMPTPASGKYIINKVAASGVPNFFAPQNDTELIQFARNEGATGADTGSAAAVLSWIATQANLEAANFEYPNIVTDGLVLNLDAGFVGSYPTINTTWYDLSGNASNGTLINGPTFNSANSGSIVFDGVNDYASTTISYSTTVSINLWIYPITGPGVFQYGDGSVGLPICLLDYTNTNLKVYVNDYYTTYSSVLTLNQWNNICLTLNPSIPQYTLYINNSLIGTGNIQNTPPTQTGIVILGDHNFTSNGNSRIASAQIYNRSLTAAEVLQNYNAQKGRFGL